MHRIDTPTAQKDKFGAGKNGFTRGNPQTGIQATDLDDDYFDMLQEELAAVVEDAGIILDKTKHNQLLTALKALLLSREHPFADIKADGAAAVAEALSNLGLTAITTVSGLTDTFPYFTSDNSAKLTPLTSFARTLLSKPDDIDARKALGLGSAAEREIGTTAGTVAEGNDSRFGKIIGAGQSWQDMSASRAAGVTYTNSTGRPIMVIVSGRNTATSKYAYVDLVTVGGFTNIDAGTVLSSISFIVPEGSTYSISSGVSITGVGAGWSELR